MPDRGAARSGPVAAARQRPGAAALLAACLPAICMAEVNDGQIRPFAITDVDGNVALRLSIDEREQASGGGSAGFEDQQKLETELLLSADGYVYHPDFLEFSVGGGPLLYTQDYSATAGSNDSDDLLFNGRGDFRFFQERPWPASFRASRRHPSVTTSIAGTFLVQRDEVGATFALRRPLSPVQLTLDAFRIQNDGSGLGAVLDDRFDEVSVNAFRAFRRADQLSVTLRWNQRDSRSGSAGLPITESDIETWTIDAYAKNVFGSSGQFTWLQQLTAVRQTTVTDTRDKLEDLAYFSNAYWNHGPKTRSFYTFRYRDTDREARAQSRNHSLLAGLSREFGDYTLLTGELRTARDKDLAFRRETNSAVLRINYNRPVPTGRLNLGANVEYRNTDRKAADDEVQVFDEAITLVGTLPVDLRNEFVIAGTVIVRNEPKTQVFAEGVDYRLITIGSVTSIQRLVGGNIADGQTVLLEYRFQAGGSVDFDTLSQSYVAELRFLRYFNVYLRFSDQDNQINSGNPTTPLNSVQDITYGLAADFPVGDWVTIGGEARITERREDIASFDRDSYDAYTQFNLPWSSALTVGFHKELVDNKTSEEDVDLVQYRGQFRTRLWRRLLLSLAFDTLEDSGGTLRRQRDEWSLGLEMNYRQVRCSLRASDVSETLGTTERSVTQVLGQVVRAF